MYYRDKTLHKCRGGGCIGNFFDAETGDEYWISGIKKRGSNMHYAMSVNVVIDDDAKEEYRTIKG